MKLEKAIEILQDNIFEIEPSDPQDQEDALKLGIEALKRVQFYNSELKVLAPPLLPGETED